MAVALRSPLRPLLPGLGIVALLVGGAYGLSGLVPSVSALLWAMGLGVALGPALRSLGVPDEGMRFAARTLLRVGVALLGLRIAVGELASIGAAGLVIAMVTIAATLAGTMALGRRLGVRRDLALLIGTGSGICGASAIAAMDASMRGDHDEDVGYAIATVTLFGTLAMVLMPLTALHLLDLGAVPAGLWIGGSIHEVAQVAGAGAALSPLALQVAMLTKLTRVLLLAPAVACVAAGRGDRRGVLGVPAFVVAFLALVALRSAVDLPDGLLAAGSVTSTLALTAGLAALGLQIDLRRLSAAGTRPLLLGLASALIAATVALGLVLALTPGL